MSKTNLKLDWCSHEAAKYACEHWHYSRCLPTGKLIKVGVWENEKFVGVIIFSRGASPFLLKKYGLKQSQGCELTRVACTKHDTPVSKMLSIALKFLMKKAEGLQLVVSFADPAQGHHGGIYQATNWIYTGQSNPTTEVYVKGKWTHMRGAYYNMDDKSKTRTVEGKHRYLFPLNKEMRKTVIDLALPYPKRGKQATGGTPTKATVQRRSPRSKSKKVV